MEEVRTSQDAREGKNVFRRFTSLSFTCSNILKLPLSRKKKGHSSNSIDRIPWGQVPPREPSSYGGLLRAVEGLGPPGTLLVGDALVVAVELVAEPSDAVPTDVASEISDAMEGGM